MIFAQQNRRNRLRLLCTLALSIVGISLFIVPQLVLAIARGYTSDDLGLQTGMAVSLSVGNSTDSKVERATQDNSNRVVGIVTTIDNSLVTVGSASAKVLVESEGQVGAYVSDINGAVNQGDNLVLSPLKGILMKFKDNTPATIIAIAAASPTSTSKYSYEDNGQQKQTNISKIDVNLNRQGVSSGTLPSDSALAKLGRSVTGKDTGELRVLVAMIIFVLVLIAEGGIIYGGVSSSITALGRNPLARQIIRSELLRMVGIALAVLLVGMGAVYAILWV